MKRVVIIGGGAIGLSTAYYLSKEGHEVVVIDAADMTDGCSYGNAGMVVPSHVLPLAQPGMIARGVRWMFDSRSPFYVRPRLSPALLSWGWQFYRNSTQEHVERSKTALRDLSLFSKELYRDLASQTNLFWHEQGLLMLYRSDKVGEEEMEAGKMARELGLEVDFLSASEAADLESGLKLDVKGAVHYRSDAHLHPGKFMTFLKQELEKTGVRLIKNARIEQLPVQGNRITGIGLVNDTLEADEVVLCAGAWSPEIARRLGIRISVLPGKGYSFEVPAEKGSPGIPSILCEGKVAVTPLGDTVRFGGTMEITHTADHRLNRSRIEGIVNTVNTFYPELQLKAPDMSKVWHGYRPCTPTGLPIISRTDKWSNLVIATGHAMMGLSLAPATGKLVEEMISGKPLSVSTEHFSF